MFGRLLTKDSIQLKKMKLEMNHFQIENVINQKMNLLNKTEIMKNECYPNNVQAIIKGDKI